MRKIIAVFLLISATIFAWTGSDADVSLLLPYSYSIKGTVLYYVPACVYGKVYNTTQGIDKHEVILKDNTTGDTSILTTVQDRNVNRETNLSSNYLLKPTLFKYDGRTYTIEIKAYDLNGSTWSDTAVIIPIRRSGDE